MSLNEYQNARAYIKAYLQDYVESITTPSKYKNQYVCPLCHSGTGLHRTGAFTLFLDDNDPNKNKYYCYACGSGGDITDLYKEYNGVEDPEAVKALCAMYGVHYPGAASSGTVTPPTRQPVKEKAPAPPVEDEPETSFVIFYHEAAAHIHETDYWQRRGLSAETVERFKIGYAKEWRHPKAPNAPASPRLIIPITPYTYTARDTRQKLTEDQQAFAKQKVKGTSRPLWLWNRKALESAEPVFVVEGEIDALSVIEVGGSAVALGSTVHAKQFVEYVKANRPTVPLILALDNDEPGQKAQATLAEGLDALGISYYTENINAPYKDANERLTSDREGLRSIVAAIVAQVKAETPAEASEPEPAEESEEDRERRERKEKETTQNGKLSNAEYTTYLVGDIIKSSEMAEQKTGFVCIDDALDGGLYEGLYSIGAISSLGKTAFVLQICDQIAATGKKVLFFSMEMSRYELMARSISRETFLTARDKDRRELAKDVRHILNGHFWKNYSDAEYEHIRTAIKLYGRYASNIYIQEGVGDITVERIAATVEAHIKEHGAAPVVVLDYLQIIAPDEKDANRTDKQITDKNIVALKRLARDKHLVILAISSFNRENYTEPVSYASFKESGAIEYSSDVLIGLQYEGMDYQTQTNGRGETVPESNPQHIARIRQLTRENDKAAKNGEPITIEVKILKCRNGAKTTKKLYYYPKYNTFTELMDFDDAAASGTDEEEARPTDTGRKRKF